MSTNCIRCGVNKRTGFDLLCDSCRMPSDGIVAQLFESKLGVFVLRMRGDSMIEEFINDGDFIVVERRDDAKNGDRVVAEIISTGEVTMKKYYRESEIVELRPANRANDSRFVHVSDVKIAGVVIGVLRSYR